ncbi:DUF6941 family protein [Xylanimonas ulmi]|uniref:Uncharacterized protein n=1 Tax=Xylanimonas ulmi TaxID=228973 RepID=A0A4Q7M6J8_9MICO|nr:hypothetical protein [Xylanibacterium ulmi]RZS61699.1 hypothetical protein EV386_2009 [Xylanibacterium ulmi]
MAHPARASITDFTVDGMLCDSAVTAEGKLYIQGGGWSMLSFPALPAASPRIGIALSVAVPYTATNQAHRLTIHLEAEDGQRLPLGPGAPEGGDNLGQIEAQFNMGRPPGIMPGDSQHIPFALNIDSYPFERPGAYAFVITIDESEMHRMPFRVAQSLPGVLPFG